MKSYLKHGIQNLLQWEKRTWKLILLPLIIIIVIMILCVSKIKDTLATNPYEWAHSVSKEDIDSYSAVYSGNKTIDYYLSENEIKDLVYALNEVSWKEFQLSNTTTGEFSIVIECDKKEYILTYVDGKTMISYVFLGKWDSVVWETDNSILSKCMIRIMNESLQVEITEQKTPIQPTEKEVLKMRKEVMDGMTEEEVKQLTKHIQKGNHIGESEYLPANAFSSFIDPKSMRWKLFTDSGEVVVGYAFDSEVPPYNQLSDITEEEYNSRYGTPVVVSDNVPIREKFYGYINNIGELLKTNLLDEDLNEMKRYMELAIDTHDVKYLYEIYYRLHDLDYYLFQYGPVDVSREVAYGSSIDIFYGRLHVYDGKLPTVIKAYKQQGQSHFKMSDGTWRTGRYVYKYKLELSGYSPNDNKDITFVVLSNDKNKSFEELLQQRNENTLVNKETCILFSW